MFIYQLQYMKQFFYTALSKDKNNSFYHSFVGLCQFTTPVHTNFDKISSSSYKKTLIIKLYVLFLPSSLQFLHKKWYTYRLRFVLVLPSGRLAVVGATHYRHLKSYICITISTLHCSIPCSTSTLWHECDLFDSWIKQRHTAVCQMLDINRMPLSFQ